MDELNENDKKNLNQQPKAPQEKPQQAYQNFDSASHYPNPVPPYPVKYKKEHRFWKGLLKFIAILSGVVIALLILFFLVLRPMIDGFLKNVGSGGIFNMLDLYKEISAEVTEKEVVDRPFVALDFNSAKIKLENEKLLIFDDTGKKIDIKKFNKSQYFNPIYLDDRQAAALLDSALDDAIIKLDNEIIKKLNINFDLKQIKLQKTEVNGVFDLSIVAFANLTTIGDEMGILGVVMPEKVYVNLFSKATIGDDEKISLSSSSIKVNKISDKALNELFNIINKVLFEDKGLKEDTVVQNVSKFLTTFLKDGINLMESTLNIRVVPAIDVTGEECFKWLTLNEKPAPVEPEIQVGPEVPGEIETPAGQEIPVNPTNEIVLKVFANSIDFKRYN